MGHQAARPGSGPIARSLGNLEEVSPDLLTDALFVVYCARDCHFRNASTLDTTGKRSLFVYELPSFTASDMPVLGLWPASFFDKSTFSHAAALRYDNQGHVVNWCPAWGLLPIWGRKRPRHAAQIYWSCRLLLRRAGDVLGVPSMKDTPPSPRSEEQISMWAGMTAAERSTFFRPCWATEPYLG